ncbi:FtsK/SpoIIIE domain-containing protein [uncultured Ruminococcus sp.]|uniref:FtsK/SpoIIIE domain-containing protein n=1 Tax=uncultured Ruminococcus sp. TaxID=165186 RepID=UPI000ED25120|nr:FtsK/SpoIIIE domain-containing protein [uncultured Ruminococcus sp.]HCJ40950.1 cell division protein FtsK [Ruminococcus sp.]
MTESIIVQLGKYDVPILQKQPDFEVDLLRSNILLFGSPQSGKTNLIRLIINILHKKMNEKTEQIFILDFGGALAEYQSMPLVSAYFDNSNEEYVKRVFKILETKLKENTRALQGVGFANKKEGQPVHITFFIDNFNSFLDEPRYQSYQEKFARLCRDGLSKGISVVVTASENKGMSSYINNLAQKIALNLTNDRYMEIFGGKVSSIGNIPGRGFANITMRLREKDRRGNYYEITGTYNINAPYEIHCNFAEDINKGEFKTNLHKKFRYNDAEKRFERQVEKYKIFPQTFGLAEYHQLLGGAQEISDPRYEVAVGLDYVDFKPVVVDFHESRFLAVYAKRNAGQDQLLSRMIDSLMSSANRKLVLFDDGRGQLKPLKEKYPYATYISAYVSRGDIVKEEAPKQPEPVQSAASAMLGGAFKNSAGSGFFKGQKVEPKTAPPPPPAVNKPRIPQGSKLSPMQQLIKYIHEECVDVGNYASVLYTGREYMSVLERNPNVPIGCFETMRDPTVFVLHSKLIYSSVRENKQFLEYIMPILSDMAEERDYIFIFSDVKKMSDAEMNEKFNTLVHTAFVLDNIAEFVSERGQKTIFGDLDVKLLKADYAPCEKGDGYYYDVEADSLKKLKIIQEEDY